MNLSNTKIAFKFFEKNSVWHRPCSNNKHRNKIKNDNNHKNKKII